MIMLKLRMIKTDIVFSHNKGYLQYVCRRNTSKQNGIGLNNIKREV